MRHERSVPDILADLTGQFTALFRTESRLARAEMSDKVRQVGAGLAMLVVGAVLMMPALVIVLGAAVAALEEAGLTPPWAAVAVGGAALLVGLVLLFVGLNALKADKLVPSKTLHQLQEDAFVARRQVRQDDDEKRAA